MHRYLVLAIGLLLALELTLLISGSRVLVWERRVQPGEDPRVDGYGPASGTQLVCTHFDGRALRTSVYWHSPNNFLGRDSCPFIDRPMN